jgi:hypothetical protein
MAIGRFQSVKTSTHAAEEDDPARGRRQTALHGIVGFRAPSPTSKLFFQTFPNFGLFSPRISKDSFGGFVEFRRVAMDKNRQSPSPNFLPSPWAR